jgi:hypothetical protein
MACVFTPGAMARDQRPVHELGGRTPFEVTVEFFDRHLG